MQPSKQDIDNFLAFAPVADEQRASLFLKDADSVNQAVDQYYENPDKYTQSPAPPVYKPETKPATKWEKNLEIRTVSAAQRPPHTNPVIEAARLRARGEQEMQNKRLHTQWARHIYNPEIEPEHDSRFLCGCVVCEYKQAKLDRLPVQKKWSEAVMYPGEQAYHDMYERSSVFGDTFSKNPYEFQVVSPYWGGDIFGAPREPNPLYLRDQRPDPRYHATWLHQIIQVNAKFNAEAQTRVDWREPSFNIWEVNLDTESSLPNSSRPVDEKKHPVAKEQNVADPSTNDGTDGIKHSKLSGFKKALHIKSSGEKTATAKDQAMKKRYAEARELRDQILDEEDGRWPDQEWRQIVAAYQDHIGMARMIANLRARRPIQYLHLLRAGYFEPIPVAWANLASNPLKFTIEAAAGWRGITPAWRGYEDTAEERLYWVLNHRERVTGRRMKPDIISALDMARARMESAVEPPPVYYSPEDVCHLQHTSKGYSKQVMPAPFKAFDAPEAPTDDTMILLDVSGSMDMTPGRAEYNQYLITRYAMSTQPKNKDVAKSIIGRFTDALSNHDNNWKGYQLTTFSDHADHIGIINHWNLDTMWQSIQFGGGTRVMTGWQKVKELHFQKHSESATYHPVYGWQAGPETPMLRLLIFLDGEATDMDEFELDLLSLSWVHVTIFLIGVDGCPHHHRHANELQRISDVNPHVSFVDAQGNTPERFVTHELLKRHLGYELSMAEFEELEQLPPYSETA